MQSLALIDVVTHAGFRVRSLLMGDHNSWAYLVTESEGEAEDEHSGFE